MKAIAKLATDEAGDAIFIPMGAIPATCGFLRKSLPSFSLPRGDIALQQIEVVKGLAPHEAFE